MPILAARSSDAPALKRLLASSGLPTDDLRDEGLEHFLVLREGDALIGAVGLDVVNDVALLRSLVVDESHRGSGLAKALVTAAEDLALQLRIRTLYLLTTTAGSFFAKRGYRITPRDEAPASIASMPQFSSLCPSTASFMRKP